MGTAIIKVEAADAHDHLWYPTYYVAYMWVNIFPLPGLGNLESSSCLSGQIKDLMKGGKLSTTH